MNEKTNTPPAAAPSQGAGPRKNNNRRRNRNPNRNAAPQGASAPQQNQNANPNAKINPNQNPNQNRNPNQNPNRKKPQHQNQNPNQNPNRSATPIHNHANPPQTQIEKIYEKYLNLLDQHLVARRKYHDLFFRADPNQKIKLEKNFYNTINDVREFEDKLNPEMRTLFEKRNNGLSPDRIYTSNHELPIEGEVVSREMEIIDPHLLQSQIKADFKEDSEESMGSIEDYLKYKGL